MFDELKFKNSTLEKKAKQVLAKMSVSGTSPVGKSIAIDPFMVITIIEILYQVFRAYWACHSTNREIFGKVLNPNLIEKGLLRKFIKMVLKRRNLYTTSLEDSIYYGVLSVAEKSTTTEEVESALSEVGD